MATGSTGGLWPVPSQKSPPEGTDGLWGQQQIPGSPALLQLFTRLDNQLLRTPGFYNPFLPKDTSVPTTEESVCNSQTSLLHAPTVQLTN